jgi:hypothetical protein
VPYVSQLLVRAERRDFSRCRLRTVHSASASDLLEGILRLQGLLAVQRAAAAALMVIVA